MENSLRDAVNKTKTMELLAAASNPFFCNIRPFSVATNMSTKVAANIFAACASFARLWRDHRHYDAIRQSLVMDTKVYENMIIERRATNCWRRIATASSV